MQQFLEMIRRFLSGVFGPKPQPPVTTESPLSVRAPVGTAVSHASVTPHVDVPLMVDAETVGADVEVAAVVNVPRAVQAYLAECSSVFGRIDINNQHQVERGEGFRAFKTVVLGEGWSGPEQWGVWTDGYRALIYLKNPFVDNWPPPETDNLGALLIETRGSISEFNTELVVRFKFNSTESEFTYSWPTTRFWDIVFPIPVAVRDEPILRLEIEIDSPKTPNAQTGGLSPDHRLLGIGLTTVEIRPA